MKRGVLLREKMQKKQVEGVFVSYLACAQQEVVAKENTSGFHTLAGNIQHTHTENTGGFHTLTRLEENQTKSWFKWTLCRVKKNRKWREKHTVKIKMESRIC